MCGLAHAIEACKIERAAQGGPFYLSGPELLPGPVRVIDQRVMMCTFTGILSRVSPEIRMNTMS